LEKIQIAKIFKIVEKIQIAKIFKIVEKKSKSPKYLKKNQNRQN